MNRKELFWNSSPIGRIEDFQIAGSSVCGKWNPYRSLSHLKFVDSLAANPAPRIFIGSPNSELNGTLTRIKDGLIEINLKD